MCCFRGKATKFYLPRELDNHQIAAVKGSHHDWAAQEGAPPSTPWYLVTINNILMLINASGFGDEEYYALYGTPEQYQRYRRDLERATKEGSPGSPQHEEYYVYRRFRWCSISQALELSTY